MRSLPMRSTQLTPYCILVTLLTFPLLLTSCSDRSSEQRHQDMLCHSHLKEAILALQEDCDNQRPRRIMLTTTIKRVAKRCGSSIFQCPISGQPYQINPDEQMWSNALKNQDARTVALYCPCR